MSAAPTPAGPTSPPDEAAAGPTQRTRSGLLRGLVRRLIDYGKQLIVKLDNRRSTKELRKIAPGFGTFDFKLIVERVIRGLRLAAELDRRLAASAKRLDREPAPERGAAPPRRTAPAGNRPPLSAAPAPASSLLPTSRQIAARIRHRPIGAVLEDICHDLGITANNPLWHELRQAVLFNGGNYARMCRKLFARSAVTGLFPQNPPPPTPESAPPAAPPAAPPMPLVTATGPP